jgi:ABC-type nitrate/sulfonate/bicarbonate transport system permease component
VRKKDPLIVRVAAALVVALVLAAAIALALAAQHACHRWLGPWMTGGDPVATAIYCKPAP